MAESESIDAALTEQNLRRGLVSVIVPCFNVEKYLPQFFRALLSQTYSFIELIVVNDGSTDSTLSIIEGNLEQLEEFCDSVRVIDQSNAGLAGAVNAGLPWFSGEFLTWPDPDDWMLPHSLEARVDAMRRYPQAGVVRSNANLIDEETGRVIGQFMDANKGEGFVSGLFDDLVFTRTFFAPICHFVRSAAFLKVTPSRSIYVTKRASQNLQMLLPIVESYPVLRVSEPLGNYCVRADSRSRRSKTADELYARYSMLFEVTLNTIPCLRNENPRGEKVVQAFYRRNKLLPMLFRCGVREDTLQLISKSSLPELRNFVAIVLTWLRSNVVVGTLDSWTKCAFSRTLGRVFAFAVRFPDSQCAWFGPEWRPHAESSNNNESFTLPTRSLHLSINHDKIE